MHVVEPSNPDSGLVDAWMSTGKRTWLLSLMKDGFIVVGLADEQSPTANERGAL
jgi:hypothetical protein